MKDLTIVLDERHQKDHLIDICILEEPNVLIRFATYNKKTDSLAFHHLLEEEDLHLAIMMNMDSIIKIIKKKVMDYEEKPNEGV